MRLQEIFSYCRLMVGDEYADLHTDARMLLHANRVLRDISSRSRCIVEGLYLPATAGQALYGLPEGFLRADIVAWQQSDGRYRPMDPLTMNIASWAVHNNVTGRPRHFDIFGRAAVERAVREVRRIGALPVRQDEQDSVVLEGDQSVILKPGDRVVNVSDGSSTGYVVYTQNVLLADNTIEQVIAYSELKGGTRPHLQANDQVRILSPGSPLHSLVVSPVPQEVGETGHEALFLYSSRVHRKITQQHIEDENDDIELDIEFENALIEFLIYHMMRTEGAQQSAETQAQMVTAETAYRRALPDVRKRIRAWIVMWYRQQGLPPRQQRISRDPAGLTPIGARGEAIG